MWLFPILTGFNLHAIDREDEAVVAGDDGDRLLRDRLQIPRDLEREGFASGRFLGIRIGPNPFGNQRRCDLSTGYKFAANDLRVDASWRGVRQLPDGVEELLGSEPLGSWSRIDVARVVRRRRDDLRLRLVRLRGHDQLHRLLEVIPLLDQIAGQIVHQVGVPRFGLHRVGRMNESAAHESVPQPVHNRA